MASKIKRSTQNSKRKSEFKKRQLRRIEKTKKAKAVGEKEFVDKKARRQQRVKGKSSEQPNKNESDDEEAISSDSELEREIADDNDAKDPEKLDETVFNQYTATGELDLPEDNEEEDLSEEERDLEGDSGEDSELDEYYRELGIEPDEMKKGKESEAQYKKKKKKESKPAKP